MSLEAIVYNTAKEVKECDGCGTPGAESRSITYRCFRRVWEPTLEADSWRCDDCQELYEWLEKTHDRTKIGFEWDWLDDSFLFGWLFEITQCDWCAKRFHKRTGPEEVQMGYISLEQLAAMREGNCTCKTWEAFGALVEYLKNRRYKIYKTIKFARDNADTSETGQCPCFACHKDLEWDGYE